MLKLNTKIIRISTIMTLLLGVISLLWLVYDYFLYKQLMPVMLSFDKLGSLEQLAEFIWLSYLFIQIVRKIPSLQGGDISTKLLIFDIFSNHT